MRLDAYVRVSRVGGRSGESFISPDVQQEQIERYAVAHGHEIVAVHRDLDVSGGTMDRPGFNDALARIERGETRGVVVAKLDRLGRSLLGVLGAVERIQAAGGTVASVADSFDLTTPTGKLMLNLLASFAEYERARLTESFDVAAARAINRGVHFTNVPPFGYERDDAGRLTPHPERATLVGEVFRRRADGASWAQLADWLNERSTTTTGSQWTARTVAHLIKNRAYLGEAFHGEHRRVDAHPPLVTLAEFQASSTRSGGTGAIRRGSPLLAGLVRCAGCMYSMKGDSSKGSRQYRCRGRHAGGRCPAPASIAAHVLDRFVDGYILTWAGSSTAVDEPQDDGALEEAERRLADARARLDEYLGDDELRQIAGRDAFLRAAAERRAALDDAEAEYSRLAADHASTVPTIHTLRGDWPTMSIDEQRFHLLRALDGVYVRRGRGPADDRVVIFWKGDGPAELPRRGLKSWEVRSLPWPESPLLASVPRWAWRHGHPSLSEDLRREWLDAAARLQET